MIYVLIIGLGIMWYTTLFLGNNRSIKKITKANKGFYKAVKLTDKRDIEVKQLYSRKVIAKLKKLKVISGTFEEDIKDDLQTLGIMDTGTYISGIVNSSMPKIRVFSIMTGMAIVLGFLIKLIAGEAGAASFLQIVLISFPLIMLAKELLVILLMGKNIKARVKEHVMNVEKDYYTLFDHFYFYYGYDSNQRKPFSVIISKFNYNVSEDMQMLIDTLLSDCRMSEQVALTNMQRRYRASLKLSELAAKLMACVNNKTLAKDNLGALKEQIKTERTIQASMEDEKISARFLNIMMISMITIMFSSIIGVMLQLL